MLIRALTLSLTLATGGAMAMPALAQSVDSSAGALVASVVADSLEHPWALAFLPDGRFLVTERPGRMLVIGADGARFGVSGVPEVVARGQGGLLDVVLAPDFAESGTIYMSFAEPAASAGRQRGTGTAVMAARLVLEGDAGRLEDQRVIFRMNNYDNSNRHFGSRIVVGQDGNLFVTLGDRGTMDRAQDEADLAGGVVRIDPNGGIPADNPRLEGWAEAFWSIGHRNPQGATLRPDDGALFLVEHGPQGGDALHRVEGGRNYGWPIITYGRDYSGLPIGVGQEQEGLEQPLHYWTPSISPSGLAFYSGSLLPEWEGDLLTGGLSGNMLIRLDMEGDEVVGEERLFDGQLGRIRDVRISPDGVIYILTDAANGALMRIEPAD
ncbi:PQQ-dependent sugar dehydrogenase [Devosia chinhatensis]|uniref:Glucose/Sorbosone dehydrogenase domain-containing protein n=1 Tax=Devosia chinhatensis TaxID=429727 RepID=A0A0F5FMR8_9HYPH|nr:PQQ-dependent sugar dehydrogenase [Devosia chinhatensis]KKB10131.1 hypothetical protein VE26_10205 [Devosia chinhatensis]